MNESDAALAWLPLAAAGDWIQVVVWAVVIGIGILNQIFGANNKKKPPQMPRRPNGGGGAQGGAVGGAAGGQKTLLDEVEKFLQDARQATARAQNRPPQQQQRPEQQQRRPSQVGGSLPSQQKPPKQPNNKRKNQQNTGQQKRRDEQPRRLTQADPSRLRPEGDELDDIRLGSSVGQHVQEHLGTSRFDERAGRLSHLRQQVEADIGGHVSSAFDHKVGSLTTGSVAATTSNDTPTGPNQVVELVAMLKDPMSMRNAVLMREILEPPSHRW